MAAIPGHPAVRRRRTPVRLAVGLGAAALLAGLWALGGCGSRAGEAHWARVTARTCTSTLARAGISTDLGETGARADPVDPARFLAERRRRLQARSGFNTVTPFRTVCSEIRQELTVSTPTGPTPTGPTPTLPAP